LTIWNQPPIGKGFADSIPAMSISLMNFLTVPAALLVHSVPESIKPFLGAAYYSEHEALPGGSCLNDSRVLSVGEAHSSFTFQDSLTEGQLQSELGFEAGTRGSFALADFSASAGFVKSSMSTELSLAASWESDYLFPSKSLSVTLDDLNATGREVLRNGHWNETCGDRFIKELSLGAKLFFSITIDFKSKESKSDFQSKFSISGSLFDVAASLNEASRSFGRNTRVTVRGYQLGGDVSRITQVFPQTRDGRIGFIQCQLGNFEKCATVISAALEYATDVEKGFPSQLKVDSKPGPAILGFKTAPYRAIGVYPGNYPLMDQATKLARKEISDAFQDQFRLAVTLDRILSGKALGDRLIGLKKAKSAVDENISFLLKLAQICYETPNQCWSAVHPNQNAASPLPLKIIDEAILLPPSFLNLCASSVQNPTLKNSLSRLALSLKLDPSDCRTLESRIKSISRVKLEGQGTTQDEFDLRLLAPFNQIEHLILTGSRLVDLSPIADLDSLKTLDLSHNHIAELEPLSVLLDLTSLNLGLNTIRNLSGLEHLSRLQNLSLYQNEIESLEPLHFLPSLQQIDLRQNRIKKTEMENFKSHQSRTLTILN
jgi:hypothetical protein